MSKGLSEAQKRHSKIKRIYRRWLDDEKFFDEIAERPGAEFSDVAEVLRNLGSAIAAAQAMSAALASRLKED